MGYVELWARITNASAHDRMKKVIAPALTYRTPSQSLLGRDSFGMDLSYYRIGLFGIPAPPDADWLNSTWQTSIQRMDIPTNLARAGVMTSQLVVRASFGGPAVCISHLGLRARATPRLLGPFEEAW
jgi:hypothetical protein